MRVIAVISGLLVVAAATVALWPHAEKRTASRCGSVDSAPAESGLDAAGSATLCLLNEQRTSHGLTVLAANGPLATAAQQHSQDMGRRAYFEHTTPDGQTVQDRIRATGYGGGASAPPGENILWGVGNKATPAA